jgi:hypothetical protein
MNIIEELVKKYNGEYSQEPKKASNMPGGKYTFEPQKGVITIDGTKISINIKAVGGAVPTAEPYRIVLHLDRDYQTRLEIFPKTNLKRLFSLFTPNNKPTASDSVNKQFSFNGDAFLIQKLGLDESFCANIENEKLYIIISKKHPKRILLTPAHGIDDINHFEKLLFILKQIEQKIKENKL